MARSLRITSATLRLLACLAETPGGWRYGYDLLAETGLKSGSLYPILVRLSERGLLEAMWEPNPQPGRPPRHLYRLTAAGRAWLSDARTARSATPVLNLGGAMR